MKIQFFRLKQLERQLERIATALEIIVREQYHINVSDPKPLTPGEEAEISYDTSLDELKRDLVKKHDEDEE